MSNHGESTVRLRVGRVVMIRHGASQKGQVAVIDSHGGGLVTVRAWHVRSGSFGRAKSIPTRDVLSAAEAKDPRVKDVKAALAGRPLPSVVAKEKPAEKARGEAEKV